MVYPQVCSHSEALQLTDIQRKYIQKEQNVDWTEECQQAFDKFKELCTYAHVLAFTVYSKPFKVHMDASGLGLEAVLYQIQGDGPESN